MASFQCPSNGWMIVWEEEVVDGDWDDDEAPCIVRAWAQPLEEAIKEAEEAGIDTSEYPAMFEEAEAFARRMDGRRFPSWDAMANAWMALGVSRFDL